MLDVSVVTYPANPATGVSLIAQRHIAEMPVESRARLRRLYMDVKAGRSLSTANADHVAAAIGELHDVLSGAGVNPRSGSAKALEQEIAKRSQPRSLASLQKEIAERGVGPRNRMTLAEVRSRLDTANRRRKS